MSTIEIDGCSFDTTLEHFAFPVYHRIAEMSELAKLPLLPRLASAHFSGTELDDRGLVLVAGASTIENLDLQETKVSNDGLACLARLPRLSYLRLKENRQLGNDCVRHLLRLDALAELQVHETSIDQHGLDQLVALPSLRHIVVDVWNGNYSLEGLVTLSQRMPECTILAKGYGTFSRGSFSGTWR